ncbi:DUF4224 domain-containing protein [Janthinobacterium sp. SUN118]|uniref:DUF4224 domain-containing protein n=1 Tax=Janthinobacterium sp. SUN118 TaxID=3004100 RepID=UPI0025B1C603|nr:DUF4224 domain-containing protein [Janthinobacterium sp. SUN118]MDN2707930.1 DUF4224 domain-containing protein [Janthinobacterium sp. SUN118]
MTNHITANSAFLSMDDICALTGRKMKTKQIEALRKMGLPFWVNAIGRPVVTVAAVEGRKEAPREKTWVMPRINKNGSTKHA